MGDLLNRAHRGLLAVRTLFRLRTANGSGDEPGSATGPDKDVLSPRQARSISRGEQSAALPEDIRRAFDAAPLGSPDDRFVGRDEALAVLEAALEQWRAGVPTMLAITSPQGAGVTSLLAKIPELLQSDERVDLQVIAERVHAPEEVLAMVAGWFQLEQQPADAHELIALLHAATPRVILIDDGHYLVNRLAGLEAVRVFGALLVATQDRHLWVLGCRGHAFARLIYLHQADRFFTHRLELSYFTEDELAEVLRHRLQRVAAPITDGEAEAADASAGLGPARLRELHQRSGGKPDTAFACLLQACRLVEETGHWCIEPPLALEVSVLQKLERPELLALAELIAHGNLSVAEHGAIFRVPSEASALSLGYLHNLGLLERLGVQSDESAVRYAVVKPIWALVAKHLETANYLY